MMCDRCGQHPASIFLTKVVNGQKTEMHLCKHCAQQDDGEFFQNLSVVNILAGLTGGNARAPREEQPTLSCPNCGFDLERFRREGRLGCEHCYEHFAQVLQPMMRKIHGSLQHTGKRPGTPAKAPARRSSPAATRKARLDELRQALSAAVKAEEYERAAGIRDEIRALETVEGSVGK